MTQNIAFISFRLASAESMSVPQHPPPPPPPLPLEYPKVQSFVCPSETKNVMQETTASKAATLAAGAGKSMLLAHNDEGVILQMLGQGHMAEFGQLPKNLNNVARNLGVRLRRLGFMLKVPIAHVQANSCCSTSLWLPITPMNPI